MFLNKNKDLMWKALFVERGLGREYEPLFTIFLATSKIIYIFILTAFPLHVT